jgi:YfiH family protein
MTRPKTVDFLWANWPAAAAVRAGCSRRAGGHSSAPFESLNLGARCGDDAARVAANRAQLAGDLGLASEPRWLTQVHGATVVESSLEEVEADAHWTDQPGLVLAILTADCLPVLFSNRAGTVVAAAHAGWRGLAAGVLEATVAALPVDADDLLIWLGPAISAQHYEVDALVRNAFVEHDDGADIGFQPVRPGHWLADLKALARRRLQRCGVNHIHAGPHCTFAQSDQFFSYRRDGTTGRQASLIWIEP